MGLNSTGGTVSFADGSSTFDSSDGSGYSVTQTNGSAQIGLFRAGGSAGGYIGADSNYIFGAWTSGFNEDLK